MPALEINGEVRTFDAPGDMPLLWVLRDVLGMTGTKFGCGIAQCGACTVHVDGNPVRSCLLPVGLIGEKPITTIEGIGATPIGAKVQKAWLDLEVIQCGYCQSGQIMSAAALLAVDQGLLVQPCPGAFGQSSRYSGIPIQSALAYGPMVVLLQ
jgi:isoquinoline 1-oxidoreductase subunit alpha